MRNSVVQSRSDKRRILDPWGLLSAALVILGCLSVGAFFGKHAWFLDNISSFRLHYALAGLSAAVLYAFGRRKFQAGAALLIAGLNGALIVPLFVGGDGGSTTPTCRLLLANVNSDNTSYDRLLKLIREENPDVILLEEVNDGWVSELEELRTAYPEFVEQPREDNFGIALYSRLPTREMAVKYIGEAQVPSIHAILESDRGVWHLIGTHPLPPGGSTYWKWRNDQLKGVADIVQTLEDPVVVLGDLNVAPWSHYFGKLLRDSGLRDGRKGFGLENTWPAFVSFLGIPIDHCLVSPGVVVCDFKAKGNIGSDHRPIVVDIGL